MQQTHCCSEFTRRNPPRRPKKYAWTTAPVSYRGTTGRVLVHFSDTPIPNVRGNRTRVARHIDRERTTFYRFSTKPNWAGLKAANAGAASVMPR